MTLFDLESLRCLLASFDENTRAKCSISNFHIDKSILRLNDFTKSRIWAADLVCPLLSRSSWSFTIQTHRASQRSIRSLCKTCILWNWASPWNSYKCTASSYLYWLYQQDRWFMEYYTLEMVFTEDLNMCASVQQNKSKFYRLDTIGRRGLHRRNASADSTGFPTNQDSKSTSGKKSKATAAKDAQPGIRKISFEHVRINRVHCRATYQVHLLSSYI